MSSEPVQATHSLWDLLLFWGILRPYPFFLSFVEASRTSSTILHLGRRVEACQDERRLIMLISRGLHALLWSTLALAATLRDLPLNDTPGVRPKDHLQQDASRHIPRGTRTPRQARLRSGWTPGRLRSRQEEQCSGSTFCPGSGDSFQCCGGNSRCCTAEDGSAACCEDDREEAEGSDR